MRRATLLLALALALLAAAPAAARPIGPSIGVGEQKPGLFNSPKWRALGLRDVRYVTPWDTLEDPARLARLDDWLARARATHARVLLGFAHSMRSRWAAHHLPTVRQFASQFRRLRGRYPWVHDWLAWNEANNGYSLTARRPRLVAAYFDAIARNCRGCRIVGADVLDTSNMAWWVERFKHYARHRPRIWGLHNYVDANHFRLRGTLQLLGLVRGSIWFTETGGVVLRRIYRNGRLKRTIRYGVHHAALATAQIFRLSCLSPRISRVYLYHWRAPRPVTNWDSGLLDGRGRPRPAYRVLRGWLARTAQASRRGGRRALCGGFNRLP